MKKLLLPTCFILLLFAAKMAKAQDIKNNTLYFFISYYNQPPPNDKSGRIDTLKVTHSNLDTVAFYSNSSNFIKEGEKISLLDNSEKILLYDYSLVTGDTFKLDYNQTEHSFLVDSVVSVLYEDGNFYTEWHLHDLQDPNSIIVWVQNLGEKSVGWNWTYHKTPHLPGVKAICTNGDLVYWRTSNDYFPNPEPTPSCNFDSLNNLINNTQSVKEIKHTPFKIYPNPASSVLFVEQIPLGTAYRIVNMIGAEVAKGIYEGDAIPISTLGQGMYILQIQTNEQIRQAKFIKD